MCTVVHPTCILFLEDVSIEMDAVPEIVPEKLMFLYLWPYK